MDRDIRPVPVEYRPAKFIAFAHGDNAPASRFKSQIHSPDSREKRQARHDFSSPGAGCSVMKRFQHSPTFFVLIFSSLPVSFPMFR
jgi:hypothetical protein